MKRIKTNIIELDKLFEKPCDEWLDRFVDGKIDAHEAFKKYGSSYYWLYENSNYDLIGWEIENDCFDWENDSWAVAQYAPQHFDPEKYNWDRYSGAIVRYAPQYFDPEKFNWEKYSWAIVRYAPQFFDPEKYNWEHHSWAVAQYAPQLFDPDKYNWEYNSWAINKFCPELLKYKPQTV